MIDERQAALEVEVWLRRRAVGRAPDAVLERALARTAHLPQRPAETPSRVGASLALIVRIVGALDRVYARLHTRWQAVLGERHRDDEDDDEPGSPVGVTAGPLFQMCSSGRRGEAT